MPDIHITTLNIIFVKASLKDIAWFHFDITSTHRVFFAE